jgi:anti-sigma B factor antagonist
VRRGGRGRKAIRVQFKTNSEWVVGARGEGDAIIVALRGEIDLNNSPDLRTELFSLLGRQAPKRLVLNLAQVPYMDSSAIAVLVETLQKVRKQGGKVYLTNLQPRVQGLIEIARLGTIFVVAKEEADALK